MSEQESAPEKSQTIVGIIGGGKIGVKLFQLFFQSRMASVGYVVDTNLQAPAILAAQSQQIPTFTDLAEALKTIRADFIFEVTGSVKVAESLHQALANQPTQLITHDMAFILLRVIEENHQKTTSTVHTNLVEIKKGIEISLDTMGRTIEGIKDTTTDLRYLALNARIEAARAGKLGRGFDIVAQQVEKTAETVRDMTQEITRVNTDISTISSRIESSLKNLE